MSRLVRLLGDVFWSAMIVLGLLIVAFFVLRVLGNVGRGTPVASVAGSAASLATPAG
jgi:hypothetical protein